MAAIELKVRSDVGDPARAVNDAMHQLLARMAPLGLAPASLLAMTWEAEHPAAYHPSRRAIDLAMREAISGFAPPIELRPGGPGLAVTARLAEPAAPDPAPAWRGATLAQLARAYSARGQVADVQAVFESWRSRSAEFVARQRRPAIDLVYGPGPNETVDLFYPAQAATRVPLWIFVHGGFWQAMDKDLHAHFAAGMLAAGHAVAVPNYALAPALPLSGIVDQVSRCTRFLHAHADAFGLDPGRVHVAGHSAGGHLAATIACDPATAFVRSSLPLSGLFELEPMRLLPMSRVLGLHGAADVDALSPARRRPNAGCRVAVAVGALEPDGFLEQSDELAAAWRCGGASRIAGRHHFDVVDELADGGPLLELALRTAST